MKKFLSKKPVMISFIVLAVVMIAVYIGILARPVSYGFAYNYKDYNEDTKTKSSYSMVINSNKVMTQTMVEETEEETTKEVVELWIYQDGDRIQVLGVKEYVSSTEMTAEELKAANKFALTEEAYNEIIEGIEKTKTESPELYEEAKEEMAQFGTFQVDMGSEENPQIFKNTQAIAFTVVHGLVTIALVAGAVLSVVFVVSKKK